ncbi:MAG: transposase [Archangium sp.]
MHRAPLPPPTRPRVLGVDNWALRKGRTYGSILVDLEAHRVVDLLPDRSAPTVAAWLRRHRGVELIARERPLDRVCTRGCPRCSRCPTGRRPLAPAPQRAADGGALADGGPRAPAGAARSFERGVLPREPSRQLPAHSQRRARW